MRSLARSALLGTACIILLVGLALRDSLVLSLLLPLTILVLLELMMTTRSCCDIVASWEQLEEVKFMEGDRVGLILRIKNQGKGADLVQYQVVVPEELKMVEGLKAFPLNIDPGEEVELPFQFELPHRGHYNIGPILLEWHDLFQVYRLQRRVEANVDIWVMPVVEDLSKCDIRSDKVRPYAGNVRSRLLGEGSEFHSMRKYQTSDGMKRINWKATGRRDELLVNEHESERSGDIVIVVDAQVKEGMSAFPDDQVERGIRAGASLSAFYLRQRDRVGLMVLSKYVGLVRPAYGRRQFYRIMERLTETEASGDRTTISVRLAMQRFFSPHSLIIYITPLDDKDTVHSIMELCHRGYQVTVVSPGLSMGQGLSGDDALGHRMDRIKRDGFIYQLRGVCQVIDWDTEGPLFKYLVGNRGWDRRV